MACMESRQETGESMVEESFVPLKKANLDSRRSARI